MGTTAKEYRFSPEATQALLKITKDFIQEMQQAVESRDPKQSEWVDPNDYMIWEGFVLPVLEDSLEKGLNSEDMLDKGFGFLVQFIPSYLKENPEPKKVCAELTKVYTEWTLRHALSKCEFFQPEFFLENNWQIKDDVKRILDLPGTDRKNGNGLL